MVTKENKSVQVKNEDPNKQKLAQMEMEKTHERKNDDGNDLAIKDELPIETTDSSNENQVIGFALSKVGNSETHSEAQDAAQEREDFLNWLSPLDFLHSQQEAFRKHLPSTGQWFLDDDCFQSWLGGPQNSVLWCPGNPGSGKTIMMSAAVDYAKETAKESNVAISYAFCDYNAPKTCSESAIWSSIIRQLTEYFDSIPSEVRAFHDRFVKMGNSNPNMDDRISLIESLSQSFERTYIFIDALDECPKNDRTQFLLSAGKLESSIRLCIVSRPSVELQMSFSHLNRIDIVANESDIRAYVEHVLDSNDQASSFIATDPTLKHDIVAKLIEQADGMFLLTHLQAELICRQTSASEARASLNTLPEDLHSFYESAFRRIEDLEEIETDLAKWALSYIFCAKAPLKMHELIHALGVEDGATDIDEKNLILPELLISICVGLLRSGGKTGNTEFVHHTLYEFLEQHPSKLLPDYEAQMARTCLTYLSFSVFRTGPSTDGCALKRRLEQYPFFSYCSHHWGHHVEAIQVQEPDVPVLAFLKNKKGMAASVQVLYLPRIWKGQWFDCFPRDFTALHAVAYWGLSKNLNAVIAQEDIDVNLEDSHGATALHLSAQNGHRDMVQLSLEHGAEVNTHNHRGGETALIWAARNGHTTTAEVLLLKGARPLDEDSEGWTALHWAVMGGHNGVIAVLLDHYASTHSDRIQHSKALCLAAEANNHKTMQMLLDKGAQIDWKDGQGSTPLHWALPEGHKEATLTLLQNGADVNSRDNYDNTPLHWAIPYSALVEQVLDHGAFVDNRNRTQETALHWSAQAGLADTIEVLIRYGADVNLKDKHGFTALHAVALHGHEAIVELLLSNGANPNERDNDGWTALHAAALMERTAVKDVLLDSTQDGAQIWDHMALLLQDDNKRALMQEMAERKSGGSTVVRGLRMAVSSGHDRRLLALLENGADIDAEDQVGGSTALTLAAWLGMDNMVKLLLENGADVNKRERSGRTALHIAAHDGYADLAAMLAHNGADINARIYRWTPMLLAAKSGHVWIVKYLMARGADVNAGDYHSRGALHWAAHHDNRALARALVQKGAEINAQDRWGRTPLLYAVQNGHDQVADLLLRLGADVSLALWDGTTALHVAASLGKTTTVSRLLSKGAAVDAVTSNGLRAADVAAVMQRKKVAKLLGQSKASHKGAEFWQRAMQHDDYQDGEGGIDGCDPEKNNVVRFSGKGLGKLLGIDQLDNKTDQSDGVESLETLLANTSLKTESPAEE